LDALNLEFKDVPYSGTPKITLIFAEIKILSTTFKSLKFRGKIADSETEKILAGTTIYEI